MNGTMAGLTALACIAQAAFLPAGASAQADGKADIVYLNGRIYTLDTQSSVASAVAVARGRLIAVGSDETAKALVGPSTQVVDLAGAPVVPGLIDSHIHLIDAGRHVGRLSLEHVTTLPQALDAIATEAARKPPGEWIVSTAWTPATQLAEKRAPSAADLDRVAPNNPVLLTGPVASANTAALNLAGIDSRTADPQRGVIRKDAGGNPTGLLEGTAAQLVARVVPAPDVDLLASQYLAAIARANSFGLTSVVAPASGANDIAALQKLKRDDALTLRFSVMVPPPTGTGPAEWQGHVVGAGAASDFGDEWLRLDSLGEMPVDGGMTFGTALTRDGYPHDPAYHGEMTMSQADLDANVALGLAHGWRYSLHAVGDAAIDRLLDAYEAAGKETSIAKRRFVVIRGSLIHKDQLERMKRLGVILQIQNLFMWDKTAPLERNLGSAVANRVFPNRLAIDTLGIDAVSQGSDFPTNSMNPWLNLYVTVTRRNQDGQLYGADQAIGREEALRSFTLSGAYHSFEEGIKGSIEIGKLADMVVLDRDYMTVPVEQIKDIRVLRTIVGGKTVFSR